MVRIILKSGKDQSLHRFHPWVFSGAVKKIYGPVKEGDIVEVYDNKESFLALGHYQAGSIAVRILSFEKTDVDFGFWKGKIEKAWRLRQETGLDGNGSTNVFRLVNAEGDGLPGFIADFYDGLVVTQAHSVGMYHCLPELVEVLKMVLGSRLQAVYDKSSGTIPFKAGLNAQDQYLLGKPVIKVVLEQGLKFRVDHEAGQKTGFFIDQREHRKLLMAFSEGRQVLNMFGYTGGFSVYALKGGAKKVHTVDSSRPAIDLAAENVRLNFGEDPRHESFATDAFDFLHETQAGYDLIILDPPAFAKHLNAVHNALQGYKRLNAAAIQVIRPGGILFTFSCSQVVSRENFRKSVFAAAANTGRNAAILHQLSQPPDHPVSIYHPEGEYLKGLVVRVE